MGLGHEKEQFAFHTKIMKTRRHTDSPEGKKYIEKRSESRTHSKADIYVSCKDSKRIKGKIRNVSVHGILATFDKAPKFDKKVINIVLVLNLKDGVHSIFRRVGVVARRGGKHIAFKSF